MDMKRKKIDYLLLSILVLGGIGLLIFVCNTQYTVAAALILLGLSAGIVTQVFTGYIIPSQRLFKFRFLFNGIANGIFIALLIFIIEKGRNPHITWNDFAIMLIIGLIVMIPIMSGILLISFNNLREKTNLKKNTGEIELYSDKATFIHDDTYIPGRLILTNQRLCFRSKKMDCSQNDLILSEAKPEFDKVKYLGVPGGFSIRGKNMKVKINFPFFWEREILKQIL